MENLNSQVAKPAFMALSDWYSGAGDSGTLYDDTDVVKAIADVKDIIDSAKTTMTDSKDSFTIGVASFYGLCVLISVLGFAAWAMGSGKCAWIVAVFGAMFLFLSWFLFALFYLVGVFLDDTCVNLSEHY